MKRETKKQLITILLLIVLLGSTAAFSLLSAFQNENQNSADWYAQIAIVISGNQYPIPADIGIVNNQTTAKVYTGNTNGVIYKSVSGDVALKDFFDAWNKTFNNICILEYCNTNTSSMKMYVWDYSNSKWVENSYYELYTIKNKDVIMIDYR